MNNKLPKASSLPHRKPSADLKSRVFIEIIATDGFTFGKYTEISRSDFQGFIEIFALFSNLKMADLHQSEL